MCPNVAVRLPFKEHKTRTQTNLLINGESGQCLQKGKRHHYH